MKVLITQDNEVSDVSVEIRCRENNSDIKKLYNYISSYDERIEAYSDGETFYVDLSEILYFESVDNKTFMYTKDKVLSTSMKLYEIEEKLSEKDFFRCSKSVVVNVRKIVKLKPEITRNIMATLISGEVVVISRRFVTDFKKLIGEE